ncbi:MAG TPA: helix-turn-helix domain-containing protein [Acidimicrobiales bacterium]
MMHTDRTHVNKKIAQGAATRTTILAAARRLFGSEGYAQTSTEDVAAAAGVTKGALYHHFANKNELMRAVYEQVKREITEQVAPAFVDNESWPGLLAGCQSILDANLDPEVRQIVLLDGPSVLGWEVTREIEGRYGAIVLRGALRKAMNAGVIERQPLVPLAQMLNGALTEGCTLISTAEDPATTRLEVGATVVRLLEGLRPGR